MDSVRVNETTLTLEKPFMIDLFALGLANESKCDERTFFWGTPQCLDLSFHETKLTSQNAFV